MRAIIEHGLEAYSRVYDADGHSLLVARSTAGAAQDVGAAFVRAIHHNGLIALAGQFAESGIGVGAQLDGYV
jgi:hypothetical protein